MLKKFLTLSCTLIPLLSYSQNQSGADVQATVHENGTGAVTLTAKGVLPKPPLFFNAKVQTMASISSQAVDLTADLQIDVLQGTPELITIGIRGWGEVKSVTGADLASWAVRTSADGKKRFLDLKPTLVKGKPSPKQLKLKVSIQQKIEALPSDVILTTLIPGKAAGFFNEIQVVPNNFDVRTHIANGLLAAKKPLSYYTSGENTLGIKIFPAGGAVADIDLRGAELVGQVDEVSHSASFRYTATAHVSKPGRVKILSGYAALGSVQNDAAYRISIRSDGKERSYWLEFDQPGTYPVSLEIIASIRENHPSYSGWKVLNFSTPQGAVVPVTLEGLSPDIAFAKHHTLLPLPKENTRRGFLPANGLCLLAWQKTRRASEGKLAFTSRGLTDVAVAAGMMRQVNQVQLKVLQGKLTGLSLRMEGDGEILDVTGTNIAGWKVETSGNTRILKLHYSVPLNDVGTLRILSQSALGAFPITATPLRLTPEGALRHSGYVRLTNAGAVRLETAAVSGMMQLSPKQFPGASVKARQNFVYRYPSANYAWQVRADQILPEISLHQVAIYEQSETDLVIRSTIELDIREAPVREWEMRIPDGYALADLTGAEVVDYVVSPAATNGMRDVKVLFKKAVAGRQLIAIRLEKNSMAKAGKWQLIPLEFPGIKSLRGQIGVAAAAGWKVDSNKLSGLAETPLSYFPMKDPGLQQSYRIREPNWSATMQVDAREQSVQADVFHLYSLKEGMAYGSVLLNYFVVGAPVTEWQLAIPESYGNVAIEGQNVRQWRRIDADKVVVLLDQPVSGPAVLLVTFENSMSARGGKLPLAQVRPLNVQGESGFVEVVSPVQVNLDVSKSTPGLLRISPQELPEEFRLLTTAPALAAWQYAARPIELEVDINWFTPGETLGQVVDFANLHSTVSRDGQVMTEAVFYVRSRGRQALRMTLPEGAKLWEARANTQTITARKDGSQYLLPLPASDDPNKAVRVSVRYGRKQDGGSRVQIGAPALTAPLVIAGWKVSGGKGRLLLPEGGNAALASQPLTETGFESISHRVPHLAAIAIGLLAGVFFLRRIPRNMFFLVLGALILIALTYLSLSEASEIWKHRRYNHRFLELSAPVVSPDAPISVTVKNLAPWQAMISWWGIIAGVIGGLILVASLGAKLLGRALPRPAILLGFAVALLSAAILAQRAGGTFFFCAIAVICLLLLIWVVYTLITEGGHRYQAWKQRVAEQEEEEEEVIALGSMDSKKSGATQVLLGALSLATFLGGMHSSEAANEKPIIDSITQNWQVKNDRLFATMQIKLNAKQGTSYHLLSKQAVLTSFNGEGLRVNKIGAAGHEVWMLVADRSGVLSATATYEMVLPQGAGNFLLPTGLAAVQKLTVSLDQAGLELHSGSALRTISRGNTSELIFAATSHPTLSLRPKGRDIDAEETKFYTEVSSLYLPSPGVVDGYHRVVVRPSSGKVGEIELTVPSGFMVSEVSGKHAASWNFDPATRKLLVDVKPAQSKAFELTIETQRGLTALPAEVKLSPLTVSGDAGETNMLGLAFGGEAQPGKITPNQLSVVNVDDFDSSLIPTIPHSKNVPRGILHKVYRSTAGQGSLSLQVAPVKPEVRVVSRQELTLGSERILLSAVIDATVTRSGIFQLTFPVPDGLEVESVSGPALSHWTESETEQNGKKSRIVTLHLTGKTLGTQRFSLSLSGAAVTENKAWKAPRLLLNEALRQNGQLIIVPEKGIRIRAVDRQNASALQVSEVSSPNQTQRSRSVSLRQKGGLAFRLLQSDWSLSLAVEKLDPWVTANTLHEVKMREGQTRSRIAILYQIEHAAVKSLQIKLPGLSEEETRTVRASGSHVKEITQLSEGVWEIHFRRGVLGSVPVNIEFQRAADRGKGGSEKVSPAVLLGTKRVQYFVALRTTGRLDVQAGKMPRGWRESDWSAVARPLRNPADASVPDACYRLNEPEGGLLVSLKRHATAGTLKLRVTSGQMMTVFSPAGDTLTSVSLNVPVESKDSLKVSLPPKAMLYNVLVNDEPVHVVRDGDAYLFHVSPPTERHLPAQVELSYSTPASDGDIRLTAPGFNVPVERVTWDVLVPDGYHLNSHRGGFELRGSQGRTSYTLEDYLAASRKQRSEQAAKGVESLQRANDYMRQGKRAEAAKELSKVTKNRSVDAASNEDARVQLRNWQTQQALWGLNTRKQRIYLDNKASGKADVGNKQLEDSAYNNPLFNGQMDFDVRRVDDFLRGNSNEEKKALKDIARRIVTQQLATEPAPQTISTIVQGRGEILRFTRGITVNGGDAPELVLDVEKQNQTSPLLCTLILIAVAALTAAIVRMRS